MFSKSNYSKWVKSSWLPAQHKRTSGKRKNCRTVPSPCMQSGLGVISEQLKLMWSNELPMVRWNCIINPWSEWQLISIAEIRARWAVAAALHRSVRCEQYPSIPPECHIPGHILPLRNKGQGKFSFHLSLPLCPVFPFRLTFISNSLTLHLI